MPPKPKILKRSSTIAKTEIPSKKATPEKVAQKKNNGKENSTARNLQSSLEGDMENMAFEDETVSITQSAIENFFMQGKSASDRMNTAKPRRGRRAVNGDEESDDEDVDKMITEFTKCDLPGLRDYITGIKDERYEKLLESLENDEFSKWKLYLATGFNILLHGVGSKREILDKLEKELKEYTYMRIDARKEGVNIKALLNSINENMRLNRSQKRGESTANWAMSIRKQLAGQQIILMIDNIESPDWRNDQEALCELLENKDTVKLIATVDHIYSTFIWNSRQLSTLSFVHITVNTFKIPLDELLTGESRLLGLDARSNQSTHTLSSLDAFWKSLAVNSQKLFRLFFQKYFETKKPVKFWDLFNAAKDDFIASTDAALRTQLVEFKDHRVLRWTRGDDGNDQLSGMVELKLITEFLESKNMPLDEKKDE
ncbi:CBN-ORC-2 protein [Caenorhabditis brenneri]|uniref:Origin recognition complex subunit 2 n=1 Tax=Caenorhabditis brenneri TaxID=135651 RepID=G0MVH6_CAEBE|nr:CBN-ORC-2 protein [Caenorhabditis brenneri]